MTEDIPTGYLGSVSHVTTISISCQTNSLDGWQTQFFLALHMFRNFCFFPIILIYSQVAFTYTMTLLSEVRSGKYFPIKQNWCWGTLLTLDELCTHWMCSSAQSAVPITLDAAPYLNCDLGKIYLNLIWPQSKSKSNWNFDKCIRSWQDKTVAQSFWSLS